ncbi:MAG: helix-turn-helix transcriptional regulator [Streptosporangiaceae bacterium]
MARHSAQRQEAPSRRQEVLRLLKAARTPLSIVTLARQLGVHPNTVRFHLDSLVASGEAEQVAPDHGRPGRPAQLFRPVRQMNRGGPRRYQLLAEILVQSVATGPEPSVRAADAGRAWGQLLADSADGGEHASSGQTTEPVGRLVSLLDELGFDPSSGSPLTARTSVCGIARSWNWRRPANEWCARSTWASCRAPWPPGTPRSA